MAREKRPVDDDHCGGCGIACGSETCVMGACVGLEEATVLANDEHPRSPLVLDATHAYWVSVGLYGEYGSVLRVALDGSGAPETLASGPNYVPAITKVGDSIYWGRGGAILKLVVAGPGSGSGPVELLADPPLVPISIAASSTTLFFANGETSLVSVPLSGGVPTIVTQGHRLPGANPRSRSRLGGRVLEDRLPHGALRRRSQRHHDRRSRDARDPRWGHIGAGGRTMRVRRRPLPRRDARLLDRECDDRKGSTRGRLAHGAYTGADRRRRVGPFGRRRFGSTQSPPAAPAGSSSRYPRRAAASCRSRANSMDRIASRWTVHTSTGSTSACTTRRLPHSSAGR